MCLSAIKALITFIALRFVLIKYANIVIKEEEESIEIVLPLSKKQKVYNMLQHVVQGILSHPASVALVTVGTILACCIRLGKIQKMWKYIVKLYLNRFKKPEPKHTSEILNAICSNEELSKKTQQMQNVLGDVLSVLTDVCHNFDAVTNRLKNNSKEYNDIMIRNASSHWPYCSECPIIKQLASVMSETDKHCYDIKESCKIISDCKVLLQMVFSKLSKVESVNALKDMELNIVKRNRDDLRIKLLEKKLEEDGQTKNTSSNIKLNANFQNKVLKSPSLNLTDEKSYSNLSYIRDLCHNRERSSCPSLDASLLNPHINTRRSASTSGSKLQASRFSILERESKASITSEEIDSTTWSDASIETCLSLATNFKNI